MPKNLQTIIEEAKKEFRELMDNPIAFDEGGCLRYNEKALLVFIEFKIQEAYREGYKQGIVDEQICMEKSGEHHINCKPS